MINLLLSGKQLLLFMIVAWSLLIYVGYNVLTVEAAEEESKLKDVCKKMDGEWKDSECKFEDGVEMGKPYSKEQYQVDFEHYISDKGLADSYYEEVAAKEDAICDNEDADSTNIKLCMSDKRELEGKLEQRDEILEKLCNKVDGKWTKEGCNTGGGDTPKADKLNDLMDKTPGAIVQDPQYGVIPFQQTPEDDNEKVIEDWGNTVTTNTDDPGYFKAQAESINTPYDEEKMKEAVADYNEVDDNQVNTDTEDSSDNTDSSDSQDSSDSEDNSSDDGGDSSDSGDDSSSSDDGGDSGDSSESEE